MELLAIVLLPHLSLPWHFSRHLKRLSIRISLCNWCTSVLCVTGSWLVPLTWVLTSSICGPLGFLSPPTRWCRRSMAACRVETGAVKEECFRKKIKYRRWCCCPPGYWPSFLVQPFPSPQTESLFLSLPVCDQCCVLAYEAKKKTRSHE